MAVATSSFPCSMVNSWLVDCKVALGRFTSFFSAPEGSLRDPLVTVSFECRSVSGNVLAKIDWLLRLYVRRLSRHAGQVGCEMKS